MKRIALLPLIVFTLASCGPREGMHTLHVLATDDVHGAWFDSSYVDSRIRPSLYAVNYYVDSIRRADGAGNVLLLDAGDCLQGDNAAYYYNYVDTRTEHLFSRLCAYMKYDAVTVGNHDIETGHAVYDRVAKQLKRHHIAFLAGNALRSDNGKPYFPAYKMFRRAGLKVLVLGYTNPNIRAWLDESLWSGMDFANLIPLVQQDVDRLTAKLKPHVVIVSVHSGTGKGDGGVLESQGLDLLESLHGVDILVCAHDHRQTTVVRDGIALINNGSKSKYLGHGVMNVAIKDGKVASKEVSASLITVDKKKADPAMREAFHKDFAAVKAFTVREIGALALDLNTRDAYKGMSPFIDLIHTVQLKSSGADISFAAPLTFNGRVRAGVLLYNDLFTIYPFENQLFCLKLKGSEIKDYLELSYGRWLAEPGSGHTLAITHRDDPRNSKVGWSFVNRTYNFDSAAGIDYTVDVTRPKGERINILGLAGGKSFDPEAEYTVAMTSYRANGGGDLLIKGAGIAKEDLESRIVGKHKEIREFLYDFVNEHMLLDTDIISDRNLLGSWKFVPEDQAGKGIESDMELLFGKN